MHAGDGADRAAELSCACSERLFGDLLRDALRRRLAPNTGLHPKQLAHAIGVSDRAVQKILAGLSDGQAGTVARCVQFFWALGDRAFVPEIYGLPPMMPVADARRALHQARQAIGEALERVA